jgi:hypothetical protein
VAKRISRSKRPFASCDANLSSAAENSQELTRLAVAAIECDGFLWSKRLAVTHAAV